MRKDQRPSETVPDGDVIREKYFETKYADRFTANNVIEKLFPELAEEVGQKVKAPHLNVELGQSDRVVVPGSRFSLAAEVELPQDVHVYAPTVKGYKPIQLQLAPSREFEAIAPVYPPSKVLYLEAIKERVPVFEGKFRITSEVKTSANPDFMKSLGASGKTITIAGKLRYQACDKTTCFLPTSIPLAWQIQVLPVDRRFSTSSEVEETLMQAHVVHSGTRALAYRLAAISAAAMFYVGLYQSRAVQHLWCPVFGRDAKRSLTHLSPDPSESPMDTSPQFSTPLFLFCF